MFDVVLLMAGQGLRSGLPMNKVFYPVHGKPIYQYALDTFLAIPDCHQVVLVIREEDRMRLPKYDDSRVVITKSGLLRQDSVAKGVACCQESIVLIHDAARANIKKAYILAIYQVLSSYQAAILAAPVTDTIKRQQDGFVRETLKRDELYAAQTPQGVMRELFLACYTQATKEHYIASDDVELIEKYAGIPAKIILGSSDNIKVTTPLDVVLLEQLLKEGIK